ncbi:MAG: carboxypeptidase regulatory-like domain-containing protein [Gemmatimonadaceae bacterium]|nr:carboxypeptidase regulatory-like domain-containing protein [Gemmatimonadaceae bacterium]
MSRRHRFRQRAFALLLTSAAPGALLALGATPPAAAPVARGFLTGRVVDKATARPLPGANVSVVGTALRAQTDLDGRFRLSVPAGVYQVRVVRLGSLAQQQDGVRIVAGSGTTVTFALGEAVVQLQSQRVTAETAPRRSNSDDALLAMQRASTRVSDGISAEAIRRAPGANAGDAIVRVTGVSVVDNKFAVVRGLAERYSNTLLNGVELPSPEPQKKIVPLDIFPSSLLESIVVSKTGTPDRPGDFAGGSVEVTTKEFPDATVADASVTTSYNSAATFRRIAHLPQRGIDVFGFDAGGRRQAPTPLPAPGDATAATERFAERLRGVWTPSPTPISPNVGAAANLGGRLGGESAPLGYVLAVTWNRQTEATPNRFFQNVFLPSGLAENTATVSQAITQADLGGIANFALRLGGSNKFGWKNVYTRSSEELVSTSSGFAPANGQDVERRIHQVRYITRTLLQSQLSGDHLLGRLFGSRLEWKVTAATARRDEPENRALAYQRSSTDSVFQMFPNLPGSAFWIRELRDDVRTGQIDWSTPIGRLLPGGTQFKVGALSRSRFRSFDGTLLTTNLDGVPASAPWLRLPPERIFTPELLGGSLLRLRRDDARTLPYEAQDDVRSLYGMIEVPIRPWLRLVAGAREERWALDIYSPRKDTLPPATTRRNRDLLPSANLTLRLGDRQNLRLAAYQTVARPDPREVSNDAYEAVAGDCSNIGNPALQRSTIRNADIRWERYPAPGEVMSVSAFAKRFTDPIVEFLGTDAGNCYIRPANAPSARLTGAEFELRRGLSFLPGPLRRLSTGINVTLVRSEATARINADTSRTLKLQGQSDRLVNASLLYTSPSGVELSLLANYFSDRVVRYGDVLTGAETRVVADVIEQGRLGIDARLRRKVGRATMTLSARNLTDNEIRFTQRSDVGVLQVGYFRPGITLSLGVGYAIR